MGIIGNATANWIVVDFDRVPNFGEPSAVNSFEIWIRIIPATGPAVQDITYAFGTVTGGAGNLLTVGAENFLMRTSLIVILAGLVLFHLGLRALRAVLFPLAFLIFMVPLPGVVAFGV